MTQVIEHHPLIKSHRAWSGHVDAGYDVDFVGSLTRDDVFEMIPPHLEARWVQTGYPNFDEEYFEWIDVFEALAHSSSTFTFVELGAGWGRWMVRAARVAQHRDLDVKLVGVEAEPSHFAWMHRHFLDNGLDGSRHQLVQAAIAPEDGQAWFHGGYPREWYGQALAKKPTWLNQLRRMVKKPEHDGRAQIKAAISIDTLLREYETVDLMDLDIQGSEFVVLDASREPLTKVRRVHIGTHSVKAERGLRGLFGELGWRSLNDYPCFTTSQTPWGPISFEDGVQTWLNPRFH